MLNSIKKARKTNRGITLIALVITIIVLLILAGVTIATLTGDNGLLQKAAEAKQANEKATDLEKIQVEVAGSYGLDGKIDIDELNKNLIKIHGLLFNDKEINLDKNSEYYNIIDDLPNEVQLNGVNFFINEYGTVEKGFDPQNLIIGEPLNVDKYGWKVKNYTVTTDKYTSGIWRLFYQDKNYTYLITDSEVLGYDYKEGESNYSNGSNVSIVGQKLNSSINHLFKESNINSNIKLTAYLTDTSETGPWTPYKNKDAVFAIGAPTLELFAASFNNRSNKSRIINYNVNNTYGYMLDSQFWGYLSRENYKIYVRDGNIGIWISSPFSTNSVIAVDCNGSLFCSATSNRIDYYVRPIVCLRTSVFNHKYGTENNLVNE